MLRSAVIDGLRASRHPDVTLCWTAPNSRLLIHELAVLSLPDELFEQSLLGILLMIQTFRCPKVSETKHLLEIILINFGRLNRFWLGLLHYGFFRLLSDTPVLTVPRATPGLSSLALSIS